MLFVESFDWKLTPPLICKKVNNLTCQNGKHMVIILILSASNRRGKDYLQSLRRFDH